jgi:adenylate cyclase
MADIFISYSSKDKEKADQLSELLASAGLSVWIDRSGIGAATSWSGEISKAITECKALIVLLSPSSIESKNVTREVALAFERNKKILPLDLEPVMLPDDFAYHLAGIQRTSMTNIDSIIRALGKLGLEATKAPEIKLVKESDARKSLMILPFEDLSPTADNEWFANGIVHELIAALSNIKSLHVTDQQTTKEYKAYKGKLTIYAKEMGIRYFVQGDVRKFGDQIKISSRLLDIETGDHLWSDSMRGTMQDIFDFQEQVAKKITEGLAVILTKEEEKKLQKKPTESAEAYELYLKGNEYYFRHTHSDYERAKALYEDAVRLDDTFVVALLELANLSLSIYRVYSRNPQLLVFAKTYIDKAEMVLGASHGIYWIRSNLARNLGNAEEALRFAQQSIELSPEYAPGYSSLSFAFEDLGKPDEAANAMKKCVELDKNDRNTHFSYIISLKKLGSLPQLIAAARNALPIYERHLRLTPDDYFSRVSYATILSSAGEHERSLAEAKKIETLDGLDGFALYNLACFYLLENDLMSGLRLLRKALERGFSTIEEIYRDHDLDPLRGTPEFEALVKELEEKIEKEKNV